jgi:hypothetical protein
LLLVFASCGIYGPAARKEGVVVADSKNFKTEVR